MSNDITKVIFRQWPDGDVIAIFPQIAGDMSPYTCLSYEHIGQHGACDPLLVMRKTKRASRRAFEPLEMELASRGYSLEIIERNRPSFLNDRREQLR